MKKLSVNLSTKSYDIIIQKGIIEHIKDYISLERHVLIIADKNVPTKYVDTVYKQCSNATIHYIEPGEASKSFKVYEQICSELLSLNFNRKDLIIALGGGVVGDLSGFVAATYMRGIEFMSIPSTTLSQIDSSIGGKVAINLDNVKNIIGSFHHPSVVLIDTELTNSLTKRHFNNGLIEALKAGIIADPSLFELFLNNNINENLEEIIYKSLMVKKHIVEIDEKEQNERKLLNYGHTVGHAIESLNGLGGVYHGEAVGLGMLALTNNPEIHTKLIKILTKLEAPTTTQIDKTQAINLIKKDKKASMNTISIILVEEIGKAYIKEVNFKELEELMEVN
ncbi:MAG: 3-dehydroquinate synthase [Erysipelotrichaceae bacterium]